ncbi:ParB/RepB/Spo0J family partition protein [bacterium]|nr:ParB/RepB/Spo0J family partition protein [bacterium]
MTTVNEHNKVLFVGIDTLQPNPFQPRDKIIEDQAFNELVESIAQFGVLEPLVVVQTPAGTHIIAGERRWRAAKKVGLTQVPVHLVKTTPKGMLEMAIVENIQRLGFTPLEKAQAIKRLMTEFGYKAEEVGKRLGKSRQYVQTALSLLNLPDPIKDGLNSGVISEGHARAISGAGDAKDMIDVYRTVVAEGASVRRAEALARFHKAQKQLATNKRPAKIPPLVNTDDYVKAWQENWGKRLTSKASVKLTDSRRGTRIVITLTGDPTSRQKDLEKIIKMTRWRHNQTNSKKS